MKKRVMEHDELMTEWLKDPENAAGYLNAILDHDDENTIKLFLVGLGEVAKAHGISLISKKTKLGRESLYKTLSEKGNPEVITIVKLMKALGLKLFCEVGKRNKAS